MLNKKEKKIFLIYKEIQTGSDAKSYIRKSFLIYEEMRKCWAIYKETVDLMTLRPIPYEFPYIWW